MPLLEIKNLQVEFGCGASAARAVDGVSLSLEAGKTLCLVGESGSGKSVTALSIAKLVPSPPARYVGAPPVCARRSCSTRTWGSTDAATLTHSVVPSSRRHGKRVA